MTWEVRESQPLGNRRRGLREWQARTNQDSSRDKGVTIMAWIPELPGRVSQDDQEAHAAAVFHRCVKEMAAQPELKVRRW